MVFQLVHCMQGIQLRFAHQCVYSQATEDLRRNLSHASLFASSFILGWCTYKNSNANFSNRLDGQPCCCLQSQLP